jgi:dsDNA-specific endonuclease/ATPase MutS2
MPRSKSNEVTTETSVQELPTLSKQELPEISEVEDTGAPENSLEPVENFQDIDEILNSLKTLLSTVEKLQKVRQEIGDIKPLLVRMLDGELVGGEELEQLKTGMSGLVRLVRAYSDHQAALTKAQPARNVLDQILKERNATPSA